MMRVLRNLLCVVLSAVLVVVCLGLPVVAKTLTIAQGVDPTTLDPHMSHDTPTAVVTSNIFDSLLRRNKDAELELSLAESFVQVDDYAWKIVVKDGIFFHNGEPFDAYAVKYSLERVVDPVMKSPQASRLRNVESVTVLDSRTLMIKTKQPDPLLPAQAGTIAILPPLYGEEVGPAVFATRPIGTGPYQLVGWKKDEKIVLTANPEYFRGRAKIEEVVFRPIPETAARIGELRTGAVDLIVNVPPHQVESIASNKGLAVRTALSSRIIFIVLTTTEGGPLADSRVRQAMNYAVDKEAIVTALLGGYGEVLPSLVPINAFGRDPSLEAYPYDPHKAKELLREAGYPNGFEITFEAPAGRYLMDSEVAQAVNSYLQDVGIKTKFQILEWGFFVGKLYQHAGAPVMLLGLGGNFDANSYLFTQFRSGEISSYYSHPEMDKLLDAARVEMDSEKRKELYHLAQQLGYEEAAVIPLYQQVDIFGVHESVVWEPRPDELILVYEMDVER